MKKSKVMLLLMILLSMSLFYVINRMTVSPGTSSGNGNPGLLLAFFLIPFLLIMVTLWVSILKRHSYPTKFFYIVISIIPIHLILATTYQIKEFKNYREVIKNALIEKDGFVDPQYLKDITSGITIHVNNQYFNLNTFLMFLSLTIFIGTIYQLKSILNKSYSDDRIQ